MSVYGQLKKAHQDELLQVAARHRLAGQARRARPPRRHHPIAAPGAAPGRHAPAQALLLTHHHPHRRTP